MVHYDIHFSLDIPGRHLTLDFVSKELDKWEYPLIAISDDIDNHLVDNYNKITEPPKLQTHPTELALY